MLRQVKYLLTIHQTKGHLVWRRLNTGAKLRNVGGRIIFTKNKEMVGLPDILVWVHGGPMMCWELKSPTGEQSKEQEAFEAEVQSMGHEYHVVKCLEDAILILQWAGL